MENCLKLAMLGSVNIAKPMDTSYHAHIRKHNREVENNRLMPHVDNLCSEIQIRAMDSAAIWRAIADFAGSIKEVRDSINGLFPELPEQSRLPSGKSKETLDQLAEEVCDIITSYAVERFELTKHLVSATLVQKSLFVARKSRFPVEALKEATEAYLMLKKDRLKMELSILYKRKMLLQIQDVSTLLSALLDKGLSTCFSETVKLLRITATTLTPAETERASSTLKKLKAFQKNTVSEDRLSALAMLSVEQQLIKDIPDFNHRTIELFSSRKEHQANFAYMQ
ncbi:uncharacterized protein LOC133381445 isoform X2 [Rhineura floridana]|uniref:uncharacterized protein LOC133381445 isoform X2 n=1 Tax=Rhineura floridana TaxID=261503 RepID=UPI002AC7F918|nr:uncharacterized protein LOC133381445 isoform X2 [Rhineura floridana]